MLTRDSRATSPPPCHFTISEAPSPHPAELPPCHTLVKTTTQQQAKQKRLAAQGCLGGKAGLSELVSHTVCVHCLRQQGLRTQIQP